jgi:Zn-dependent protease with chaperone function
VDTSWLLPAALALAPGAYAWWTGRRLAARRDDPELPELLLAHRLRVSRAWVVGGPVLVLVPGGGVAWVLLLALGIAIGGFPLRRRLLDEQWGLARYLLWCAGTLFAAAGLVLALLFIPLLIVRAQPYHWIAALAALVLLQVWRRYQFRVWLWAYRAVPLDRPALRARFDQIVHRAGSVSPALYQMGPKGGKLANAFALPDPREPSVAFGHDLLDLLDEDEAAAIFAHELGHLEQHDARRVRRLRMRMHALVACAVAGPLVLVAAGWGSAAPALLLGAALLFTFVLGGSRRAQADETAADARAAELMGDPEVVVRALVRLHQYARLPRRWPHEMETGASHPSLVRRIAALRGGAGPAPAPGVLRSPREGSWVAFDERRVSWLDGVPAGTPPEPAALHQAAAAVRTVAYAELADLRVRAGQDARPVLQATDRAGNSWSFPLFAEDADTVRERVHQVDTHFAAPAPVPSAGPRRAVAVVALLAAWWSGAWALLLPVLLAVLWPATTLLAALGVMALGMGGMRLADGTLRWASPLQLTATGVLALAGAAALALSFTRGERRGAPRRPGLPLVGLALLAGVALARVAVAGAGGVLDWRGGEAAALAPGLLLLGLGAGLLRLPGTAARRGGAAAAGALGIAALLLSVGADGLNGRAPRIRWARGHAAPAGSVALPRYARLAAMSPSGRAYLVRQPAAGSDWAGDGRWRFTVGDFAGFQRALEATDAAFASDGHLLVVQAQGDSAEVRMEPVAAGAPLWRHVVRGVANPTVAVDGRGGWTVMGMDPAGAARVLVAGGPGGVARTRRVPMARAFGPAFPLGRGGMVVLHPVSPADGAGWVPWMLRPVAMRWEAWRVDGSGEFPLGRVRGFPACAGPDERGGAVCEATDGSRATLWSFGHDGAMTRVGQVPPDLYELNLRHGMLAGVRSGEVAVIRPDARRGWRVRLPDGGYASAAHPVPGGLAVISMEADGSTLRLFRTTLGPR